MARYFVKLDYNGAHYHGWQFQPNAITVQEKLNKAFKILFKEDINITGAGRTDTGVHARNFIAHFDSEHFDVSKKLQSIYKLNSILPHDISIKGFVEVDSKAHARFDATSRTYKYYIYQEKDVFNNMYSWKINYNLDVENMNNAARAMLAYRDFTSFSKLHTDVKTNNCLITAVNFISHNNQIMFTITADRFLRNMVRSIVGTLVDVGIGKLSLSEFHQIIEAKDRAAAGMSAPAQGLFLENIQYPYKLGF